MKNLHSLPDFIKRRSLRSKHICRFESLLTAGKRRFFYLTHRTLHLDIVARFFCDQERNKNVRKSSTSFFNFLIILLSKCFIRLFMSRFHFQSTHFRHVNCFNYLNFCIRTQNVGLNNFEQCFIFHEILQKIISQHFNSVEQQNQDQASLRLVLPYITQIKSYNINFL